MTDTVILAVDPGINNGVAVLHEDRRLLMASEIPHIGEGANKRLNLASFADVITGFRVTHAVMEDVGAMPGQGVSSTFRFGRATGALEGAIQALRVPITFVRPAQWKKDIGAKAKADEDIRALAIQTWPDMAHRFGRKLDHNRAEAALIALWYLQFGGVGQRVFVGGEGWKPAGSDILPGSSVFVSGEGWTTA